MRRVEIAFKPNVTDALGNSIREQIVEDLRIKVEFVRTMAVYSIDADLTDEQVEIVARDLLADPLTQVYSYKDSLARGFSCLIEVGYKPGVTDNVGRTTVEGIEDLLNIKFKEGQSVHTSRLYLIEGNISISQAERICTGFLANPLIEDFQVWREKEWPARPPAGRPACPSEGAGREQAGRDLKEKRRLNWRQPVAEGGRVAEVNLDVSDEGLMEISSTGVLSLSLAEMQRIRSYYQNSPVLAKRREVGLKANPTDAELEMIAQTWSEHCKHKIFTGLIEYTCESRTELIDSLMDSYIKKATREIAKSKDWLVSVFVDNAGIISFDDKYNLVFKVETHNHPSALDPYGGAVTGIVGVNRDPMGTGLGANLIFNTDVFCFGPPDFPYKELPPAILHPKRIFRGVRKGVEDGGNKIGIPTIDGAVLFDESYVYNPLVYCGTGGLMPKKIKGRRSDQKKVDPGDLVVMVGGRIGKDGIHGATFSSTKLDEATSSTAVQIGAPIVQKKMMDVLMEARDRGLYNAITDNGAGGLSSSVGEMAQFCGGCEVHLEKVPTKYSGLDPWELWVSESQERMTLAVPPKYIDEFLELCRQRDVEATVIGKFLPTGMVHVFYKGRTVVYLDMDFVHHGLPRTKMVARWEKPNFKEPPSAVSQNLTVALEKLLSNFNICSKEWVVRQYDHEVQGASVIKPLVGRGDDGPSDAAVIRPVPESKMGVVVANGINPWYGRIDTYWMAASVIDEAVRNAVAVGANVEKIAILDNFCWGNPLLSKENPDGDYKLGQLVRAAKACYDAATGLGVPFISGKDSLHNEYQIGDKTISIPPTLLISAMGVIDDCTKAVSMDVKEPGDLVYILGKTYGELGGSQYWMLSGYAGNRVPKLDPPKARKLYQALNKAMAEGLVASCHDCSEGGLAVAAAEAAFAGGYGLELDLRKVSAENLSQDDEILFSESNSRFVVTVSPQHQKEFEETMVSSVWAQAGKVREDNKFVAIGLKDEIVIEAPIERLKEVWQKPLRW